MGVSPGNPDFAPSCRSTELPSPAACARPAESGSQIRPRERAAHPVASSACSSVVVSHCRRRPGCPACPRARAAARAAVRPQPSPHRRRRSLECSSSAKSPSRAAISAASCCTTRLARLDLVPTTRVDGWTALRDIRGRKPGRKTDRDQWRFEFDGACISDCMGSTSVDCDVSGTRKSSCCNAANGRGLPSRSCMQRAARAPLVAMSVWG